MAARTANGSKRRARNGSARQITHNTGTATIPATINCARNRGNTESRNENVSLSMIRKSRNVSDSCKMSNLKRDSAISSATRISASAAETPGRGSTSRKTQFKKTHARSDSVIAKGPYSVANRTASAARCNVATKPTPK